MNTNDRPTPETDLQEAACEYDGRILFGLFEFIRGLERQRDEAREVIKEAHATLQSISDMDGLFGGEAADFYKAQSLAEQTLEKLKPFITSPVNPRA